MMTLSLSSAFIFFFFFLMIRRPPRSTLSSSSAASDVYKRQVQGQRGDGWVLSDRGVHPVREALHQETWRLATAHQCLQGSRAVELRPKGALHVPVTPMPMLT
eukprot:TRINITY_DN7294_c0_g1_i6.p1 TRINITY_DN7294_c0_g1~~TRINITY_DN7294_c0_g1_i6.p1  ORF type:complete len:103 (+),score=15.02 TRINITY_DN7294_c0_g1_i6:80-388(+)